MANGEKACSFEFHHNLTSKLKYLSILKTSIAEYKLSPSTESHVQVRAPPFRPEVLDYNSDYSIAILEYPNSRTRVPDSSPLSLIVNKILGQHHRLINI
jgi:hypothetical protein